MGQQIAVNPFKNKVYKLDQQLKNPHIARFFVDIIMADSLLCPLQAITYRNCRFPNRKPIRSRFVSQIDLFRLRGNALLMACPSPEPGMLVQLALDH
jgi:hypothetical protein